MDMLFGRTSLLNLGASFYPYSILLNKKTHKHLGMRFANEETKIFIDIPIDQLQTMIESTSTDINELIKEAQTSFFHFFQFFPVGLPYQFCNIDMGPEFCNINGSSAKHIKTEYFKNDLTSETLNQFISFIYPCGVVRVKKDKSNSHLVEHLYAINRTIYNTDFIERFKIDGPINIYSVSNSPVSAVCFTRYFDMNIGNKKTLTDFNKELWEFKERYTIPLGLDINIGKEGKDKIVITPKQGDLELGEMTYKSKSIILTPQTVIEHTPSLFIDVRNCDNNPSMYILPNTSKTLTQKPEREPIELDYEAVAKIAGRGYMNTRYILTDEDEFTILPECRIDSYTNIFNDICDRLTEVLEKEDVGEIIENMKTGKIEVSKRASIEDTGLVYRLQIKIPVDYGAFGEKNKEEAYETLKHRFDMIRKDTCDDGTCAKTENEFCFEFKILEKEPDFTF